MRRIKSYIFLIVTLLISSNVTANVDLDDIRMPDGFSIEIFAEVPAARSLAAGPDGIVFVSTRVASSVYAIVPIPGGQRRVVEIANDLSTPNGIAWFEGDLYVAEISRILVYRDIVARLADPPEPEVLDVELPSNRSHGWRYIAFGPDGKLYITLGAPCNICDEDGFMRMDRMNPDGSERETIAYGVRNSVGYAFHPETGNVWFTDNGRDRLGDNLPPDELNHLSEVGLHFGYPYCHGGDVPDPEYGDQRQCSEFEPPAQKLGPHVAPLGLAFYTGDMFPDTYRGHIFVAEHGSWNRSRKIGYRVTLVRLAGSEAQSYEIFADGWLDGETALGRPVDVLQIDDGSLLVSDDLNGLVYRIIYEAN